MALVLITHDMGVVAETAERVAVLYAGQKVEEQGVGDLFADPHHPYTAALLAALPERAVGRAAAVDPRRRARPVRPADRLPVLAALPVRRPPLPRRSAAAAGARSSATRSATIRSPTAIRSAIRPRRGGGRMSRQATRALVLKAENLTQHYRVRRGPMSKPLTLKAVDGVSFSLDGGQDAGRGRRIGLRQVHAGAHDHHDRDADVRHLRHRRARDRRRRPAATRRHAHARADRLPESLRLAQPAPEGRRDPGGAAGDQPAADDAPPTGATRPST